MLRIGFGNDIHRLSADRPLMIGGVMIESDLGAIGHSDADVLLHAVTDALLGALALGDIGTHFPNNDPRWKDADSSIFLRKAVDSVDRHGYAIGNLDATVSLEAPKLRPYIDPIRKNLAGLLGVGIEMVSVKAKTGEGLDAVGERTAIRADAVVLIVAR